MGSECPDAVSLEVLLETFDGVPTSELLENLKENTALLSRLKVQKEKLANLNIQLEQSPGGASQSDIEDCRQRNRELQDDIESMKVSIKRDCLCAKIIILERIIKGMIG